MATTTSPADESIKGVEDALAVLVMKILDHRAALPRPSGPFTATPLSVVVFDGPYDHEASNLSGILRDPVEWGLRSAVKELGRQTFRLTGSTDGMRAMSERVGDRHPGRSGRVMDMLDSAWDGVGSETDRWWR